MARRVSDPYAGPTTLGIDVSKWQGDIDWKKVPFDDLKFVICRTGDGKDVDPMFEVYWNQLAAYEVARGSYHYLRADRDGKFQAELVLKTLEANGGLKETDLPPALDLEGGAVKNLPGGVLGGRSDLPIELVLEESLEFLETIESELGILPIMYTGQMFHWMVSQKAPQFANDFAKYPLWVPSYSKTGRIPANYMGTAFPWEHWTMWQYKSDGVVPGIKGGVDMNRFRGDEEAFRKWVDSLRKDSPDISELEKVQQEIASLGYKLHELTVKLVELSRG